jgi:superfamily II DNA helicase RecQ
MEKNRLFNFDEAVKYGITEINKKRNTMYVDLREKQRECLLSVLCSDCIAILPTGAGKSLIFEMIPYCEKYIDTKNRAVVLVISPLNSIIEEQHKRYSSDSIIVSRECLVDEESSKNNADVKRLRACNVSYVLGHPEQMLSTEMGKIFRLSSWSQCNVYIVIDEVHCVVQYGEQFRPLYAELFKLRSFFPAAKWLALTATASKKMLQNIASGLMMTEYVVCQQSVDRPNIFMKVVRRAPSTGGKHSAEESFMDIVIPLLSELHAEQENFRKTVVYCKRDYCGLAYERAVINDLTRMTSMYHTHCTEEASDDRHMCLQIVFLQVFSISYSLFCCQLQLTYITNLFCS